MSDLVSPSVIEEIVGVPRHESEHYGRAVTAEETFYVLHSHECLQEYAELRDCPYSLALDAQGVPSKYWQLSLDTPVPLRIAPDGALVPAGYAGS